MVKKCMCLFMIVFILLLSGCTLGGQFLPIRSIEFSTNYGTHVDSITGLIGKSIDEPTPPTKEHYRFVGWYTDRDLTDSYVFDRIPSQNIMLYAKWEGTIHETSDGLRLLMKDDGLYGVESYVGTNSILVVPPSYQDIEITSIEINAFKHNEVIEKVTLPNTITLIREGAFFGVDQFVSFVIPASVDKLESHIFNNCQNLRVIHFEETSNIKIINDFAFSGITNLFSITLPSSVEEIGEGAFFESSTLLHVLFWGEQAPYLKTIGEIAFCSTSLEFFVIPLTVTSIGRYAFGNSFLPAIKLYANALQRPSDWHENFYKEGSTIEWGTTRKVVEITVKNSNDEIQWLMYGVSGTNILESASAGQEMISDLYYDVGLTQPCDITLFPQDSITLYTQLTR